MLHYVIQVMVFQLIFLLAYDVFLRRETFFDWNRLYLLLSSILSLVIPFLKFESVKNIVSEQFVIRLPEIIIGDREKQSSIIDDVMPTSNPVVQDVGFWSWELVLYLGMGIATLLFAIKLIQLLLTLKNNPKRWRGDLLLVSLIDDASAYSFFHYVFLGDKIPYSEQQNIIKHEQVHAQQKHTLDLLFFEVFRIVFWFNPLVYIYQYRIKELHEFIADGEVAKQTEVHQYCQQLLSELFQTKSISFINPFIKHSLIKKRIVMLQKTKSKQVQQFKYLLIVPIVFGMLLYTASYAQQSSLKTDQVTQELSGEALLKKYYDEFVEIDNTGGDVFEFYGKKVNIENYIHTRSEFYRTWAIIKLLKEKGQFEGYEIAEKNRMPKTYDEYLQFKSTMEAKQRWESQARGGDVRLVVDDIKNLTATERIN